MFARIKYLLHIEKGLVYPRFDSSAQGLMHGCIQAGGSYSAFTEQYSSEMN